MMHVCACVSEQVNFRVVSCYTCVLVCLSKLTLELCHDARVCLCVPAS